jgi:hypothetical protein
MCIVYSKTPWYPKLLFQRENALASFAEGLGNSTKTLPGNDKTFCFEAF